MIKNYKIWLAVFGLIFSPHFILAATLNVPADYPTIQAAVSAANVDDTVAVDPGVYSENVTITKRINLVAKTNATETTIQAADPNQPAIYVYYTATWSQISGFDLRGATGRNGIVLGADYVTIRNNIIEGNQYGIILGGDSVITGNIFKNNSSYDIYIPAGYDMGAGMVVKGNRNRIYQNNFYGTSREEGANENYYRNYWSSENPINYKYNGHIFTGYLGNYWANYTGVDADGNGVGDTSQVMFSGIDPTPLMAPAKNYQTVEANKDKFVYVALGDSYQSGEGAGNSISDTNEYLNTAYENGKNYTWKVNDTNTWYNNTYIKEVIDNRVVGTGDGCHRALLDYAKINKNKLEPGIADEDIALIDLTCSGSKIEPGTGTDAKPPIVGVSGTAEIDPDSQVAQALARLKSINLTAKDVDLVTVGMGGNDANFVGITYTCLAPNVIRRILAAYPNAP